MNFYREILQEQQEKGVSVCEVRLKFVLSADHSRHCDVENKNDQLIAIEKRAWESNSGLARSPLVKDSSPPVEKRWSNVTDLVCTVIPVSTHYERPWHCTHIWFFQVSNNKNCNA